MEPFPEIGMTNFLEHSLSQFNPVSDIHPARSVLPETDLIKLAPLRHSIQGTVRQREGRGVTFALFANDIEYDVRPSEVQMPLRRLLSGLYIYHYCSQHNATRMTGFPGISMFDTKESFPLYDFCLLEWILQILGYWEFEEKDRYWRLKDRVSAFYSQEHTFFVETLHHILSGARAAVEYEGCSLPILRHRIQSLIAGVVSDKINTRRNYSDMYEFYQFAVATLLEINRALEVRSVEYMSNASAKLEMRGIMNRLLIFTATDTEDEVVYQQLSALTGFQPKPSFCGTFSYFSYGIAGGTELFHVRSHAGSVGGSGAIALAQEAIPELRPDVCLSVGICFGLSQEKLNLGDVVVGQRVHSYEPGKESEGGFIPRGPSTAVSPVIFDRLRSTRLVTDANFKTHYGLFLSGEKLSNSEDFVRTLVERNPEALAGDMEAHGLAEICQRHNCDFAVIKGVADWGKGKTDDYQQQAAENAVSA
jgi:nucleoside phosphorylase